MIQNQNNNSVGRSGECPFPTDWSPFIGRSTGSHHPKNPKFIILFKHRTINLLTTLWLIYIL